MLVDFLDDGTGPPSGDKHTQTSEGRVAVDSASSAPASESENESGSGSGTDLSYVVTPHGSQDDSGVVTDSQYALYTMPPSQPLRPVSRMKRTHDESQRHLRTEENVHKREKKRKRARHKHGLPHHRRSHGSGECDCENDGDDEEDEMSSQVQEELSRVLRQIGARSRLADGDDESDEVEEESDVESDECKHDRDDGEDEDEDDFENEHDFLPSPAVVSFNEIDVGRMNKQSHLRHAHMHASARASVITDARTRQPVSDSAVVAQQKEKPISTPAASIPPSLPTEVPVAQANERSHTSHSATRSAPMVGPPPTSNNLHASSTPATPDPPPLPLPLSPEEEQAFDDGVESRDDDNYNDVQADWCIPFLPRPQPAADDTNNTNRSQNVSVQQAPHPPAAANSIQRNQSPQTRHMPLNANAFQLASAALTSATRSGTASTTSYNDPVVPSGPLAQHLPLSSSSPDRPSVSISARPQIVAGPAPPALRSSTLNDGRHPSAVPSRPSSIRAPHVTNAPGNSAPASASASGPAHTPSRAHVPSHSAALTSAMDQRTHHQHAQRYQSYGQPSPQTGHAPHPHAHPHAHPHPPPRQAAADVIDLTDEDQPILPPRATPSRHHQFDDEDRPIIRH